MASRCSQMSVFCSIFIILDVVGNGFGKGIVQRHLLQEDNDADPLYYGDQEIRSEVQVVYASLEIVVPVLVAIVIVVIVIGIVFCVKCMRGNQCYIAGSHLCNGHRYRSESTVTFPDNEITE